MEYGGGDILVFPVSTRCTLQCEFVRRASAIQLASVGAEDVAMTMCSHKAKRIILASASPRRSALLTQAGIEHEVIPSSIDEVMKDGESPIEFVERMASEKAHCVRERTDAGATIVSADTVVVLDGRVFGKPRDREHAREILHALSGRQHEVLTGLCVLSVNALADADTDACHCCVDSSKVWFVRLSDTEVNDYLDSGEYADKAGAYAIQGVAARFVERIDGSYSGIVGLPLHRLAGLLGE